MRAVTTAAALLAAVVLPGCVIVQTGVTNPIPGMTTVAVAPFINLSAERAVDGRRFALAYHAELQKVPGYQVVPVGVTEQAMVDLGLDLDGPEDALRLAEALGADAVVVGAVTDYNPYYPPRIGLQVAWYAPQPWRFSPGVPVDPHLGDAVRAWRFARNDVPRPDAPCPCVATVVRAQSPDGESKAVVHANGTAGRNPISLTGVETADATSGPILFPPWPAPAASPIRPTTAESTAGRVTEAALTCPPSEGGLARPCPPIPGQGTAAVAVPSGPHDPNRPIMAYTRLFDGSDAELTALLRDYVTLSGDLRSGGWEAYLHRTEDFIRFASHRMIVEMLTLHGGETKRRYVWMLPQHQH